jgi:hypothetical protein
MRKAGGLFVHVDMKAQVWYSGSVNNTRRHDMELTYTYWQNGDFCVGFLDDYPNDSTQGRDLAELEEALAEVYEIRQEEKRHLAGIRHIGTLRIPA